MMWLYTGLILKLQLLMKDTRKLWTEVDIHGKSSVYVQSLFCEHQLNAWAVHPGCPGILVHSSKFSLQPTGPLRVLRERSIGAEVFQADCSSG